MRRKENSKMNRVKVTFNISGNNKFQEGTERTPFLTDEIKRKYKNKQS
jgi:hypothetical protein